MQITEKITITNEDCMELLKRTPDNFYDLAICDPPYGNTTDVMNLENTGKSHSAKRTQTKLYENVAPSPEYFAELKRVSKRQIIWGANFFGLIGGMIYWHKNVTMPTYSTGELAWISWMNKLDFVDISWHGMIQHDMKNKETRIHPTQKPVALYKWLLSKYAKPNDKILDTHLGSMSIAIACRDMGFELVGCELDHDYFNAGIERVKKHVSQLSLFAPEELTQKNETLFD